MNAQALTIVLVQGGFVDGSGWEGVHDILKKPLSGFAMSLRR